jgi:hypothetical protein
MTHPTEMNAFQRNNAKRGVKPSEREKSWGTELKEKALAPATQGRNRFGSSTLPTERKIDVPVTRVQRTSGGTIMDAKTLEAKAAMEEGKKDAVKTASIMKTAGAIATDPATVQAFAIGWMQSTPTFYVTPFNALSLKNAVEEMIVKTGRPLGVELFNECAEWLLANNHLETAAERKRGQVMAAAPTVYPAYNPPAAPIRIPIGKPVSVRPTVTPAVLPEGADARTMPMDELRRAVRATYKPEVNR